MVKGGQPTADGIADVFVAESLCQPTQCVPNTSVSLKEQAAFVKRKLDISA
jgi:hypothetical protein